jgi:tetratricopeptide (TPR) repeat protein
LLLAVTEDPRCPRNAFYYARELTFYSKWEEAVAALNKDLAMPEATWQNERAYAMRLLGKSYAELGNQWEAIKWFRLGVAEAPGTREPWCELAMICYRHGMWAECYAAALSALNIRDKQLVYTMNPDVWTEQPHDLASIAAWNLGLTDSAIEHCQKALEFAPENTRLINNLASMREQHGQSTTL